MSEEQKMPAPRTVKNLAELKRLIQPGTELRVTSHSKHPGIVGLVRVVTEVQTNAFYSVIKDQPDHVWSRYNGGKGGRSDYEKAGNYIFEGTTVTVLDPRKSDGSVLFQFELLENEQTMREQDMEASEVQEDSETITMGGMSL